MTMPICLPPLLTGTLDHGTSSTVLGFWVLVSNIQQSDKASVNQSRQHEQDKICPTAPRRYRDTCIPILRRAPEATAGF